MENINTNYIRQVPNKISLNDVENIDLMFNTKGNFSVLSEYQLSGIQEVREHNYDAHNEYNLNGEIISEEEIVGSNGDFYIGFYSEIAYLQLRVCYRNDMVTIVRYRSADKDAEMGEWNSDITFIIHHNSALCRKAEVNQGFKSLIEKANEYEYCIARGYKIYDDFIIEEEIIEDIEELEEVI